MSIGCQTNDYSLPMVSDTNSLARDAGSSAGEKADGAENGSKEKEGEDSRFMARTYNLLTASQGDLGEMMDEYSIYPE